MSIHFKILQWNCIFNASEIYLLRIKISSNTKREGKQGEIRANTCRYTIEQWNIENWQHGRDEECCIFCVCKINLMKCPYLLGNRKSANKLPNICDALIELKFSVWSEQKKRKRFEIRFFVRFCENICFVFGKWSYFVWVQLSWALWQCRFPSACTVSVSEENEANWNLIQDQTLDLSKGWFVETGSISRLSSYENKNVFFVISSPPVRFCSIICFKF